MDETTQSGAATQADADPTPQAGTAQGSQQTGQGGATQADEQARTDGSPGEGWLSPEDARKLRSEAKGLRERLKPLETAEETRKREQQSEAERIATTEKERDTAREQLRRERVERRVLTIAVANNAVDPDAVVRLIDHDEIEYDSDGKPTNVESLVKALLTSKPYLAKATRRGSANGGEGTTDQQRASGDMNSLIRRGAGREG